MTISVLIADDEALVGNMLRDRLEQEQDMSVLAVVPNAQKAVLEASRRAPDVVVMDVNMPGMSCFEAVRTIHSAREETRAILLSSYSNDCYIDQALAVGVAGYLTKSESPEVVVDGIRAVHAGRRCFSAEIQARIVVDEDGPRVNRVGKSKMATLSKRELEILRYVASGLSQKQIAELTHRSNKTIHKHCSNIMSKIGIHDRVAIARFAIREGLAQA